jgi:methylmalonyl-CoA mutase C-terminal domain/subunit
LGGVYLFTEVVRLLREKGAEDVVVVGRGIIPHEDIAKLKEAGIKGVFLAGISLERIIKWTQKNVEPRH